MPLPLLRSRDSSQAPKQNNTISISLSSHNFFLLCKTFSSWTLLHNFRLASTGVRTETTERLAIMLSKHKTEMLAFAAQAREEILMTLNVAKLPRGNFHVRPLH